jgi:hypothetical protein
VLLEKPSKCQEVKERPWLFFFFFWILKDPYEGINDFIKVKSLN